MNTQVASILAQICGWIYYASWAFFMPPQLYMNWRDKSVGGLSLDSVLLDQSVGTFPYGVFCITLYFSPTVRAQYFAKHGADAPDPVKLNDLVLLIQACFDSALLLVQVVLYRKGHPKPISKLALGGCIGLWAAAFLLIIGIEANIVSAWGWNWLTFIEYMGYMKTGCSFVKYCPQVYYNWLRKSTVGFSIVSVFMDFSGAFFSVLQMVFDCLGEGNWTELTGNLPKLLIGIEVMMFDVVFVVQHYCLYANAHDAAASTLLINDDTDSQSRADADVNTTTAVSAATTGSINANGKAQLHIHSPVKTKHASLQGIKPKASKNRYLSQQPIPQHINETDYQYEEVESGNANVNAMAFSFPTAMSMPGSMSVPRRLQSSNLL